MRKYTIILTAFMLINMGFLSITTNNIDATDLKETKISNKLITQKINDDNQNLGPNPYAIIETSMGTIKIELFMDIVPNTVNNFINLSNISFYDGLVFHRVIDDFVIQGGGFFPDGKRKYSPFGPIDLEIHPMARHVDGAIGMARTSDPNSATCQFYICDGPQHFLDDNYAVFGKVTSKTMSVVRDIAEVETTTRYGMEDWPVEDVIINSLTIETKTSNVKKESVNFEIIPSGNSKIKKLNEEGPLTTPTEYIQGTILLNSRWGQHGDYKGLCPEYWDFSERPIKHGISRLGCWSTAIAQIIRYYELQSSGSISYTCSRNLLTRPIAIWPSNINNNLNENFYDWDFMPYNLNSSSTNPEITMTQQFCYDVACVIQKDFGDGKYVTLGDDFNILNLMVELHEHFPDIESTEWIEDLDIFTIIFEITLFRPIMLYIRTADKQLGDKGYHAVVLDGYKYEENKFKVHLNYGWDTGNPDNMTNSWYVYNEAFPIYDDPDFRQALLIRADPPIQLAQLNLAGYIKSLCTAQSKSTNRSIPIIYYQFDWGDGSMSEWMGRYAPLEKCNVSHSYNESGIYTVRVRAKDFTGWESRWSEPVMFYIAKNPRLVNFLESLLKLIDRFPRLEPFIMPIIEKICR